MAVIDKWKVRTYLDNTRQKMVSHRWLKQFRSSLRIYVLGFWYKNFVTKTEIYKTNKIKQKCRDPWQLLKELRKNPWVKPDLNTVTDLSVMTYQRIVLLTVFIDLNHGNKTTNTRSNETSVIKLKRFESKEKKLHFYY